ncbi:MAG: hypothetical protein HY290_04935 [Planctomycetia bacterium]|nr:hypothetical protein [Planctomycetia bacterium]
MANARTILISLDHLVAEMTAFPFAAEPALRFPVEELSPGLDRPTAALWRETERYFVAHFPHTHLDELIALRNSVWFARADQRPIPLHAALQGAAAAVLVNHGAIAEPTLPDGSLNAEPCDPAARRAWRWLTFAMPADLLLAGLSRGGSGPLRVNLLSPAVAAVLEDGGYAETHLHYGIALNFPTAWASAVNIVGRAPGAGPSLNFNAFSSPGAEHAEGERLASWLVRGAIVRYLLAAFLTNYSHLAGLDEFLKSGAQALPAILTAAFWTFEQIDALRAAIRDLFLGQLNSAPWDQVPIRRSFVALQRIYNRLTRVSLQRPPSRLDDVQRLDPLSDFFPAQGFHGASVQLQFLWKGLDYLERRAQDRTFARLFWQVERVRGQVYRHCIQRPLTPGLMNFIRFYERKGPVAQMLEDVTLESAGVLGGIGHGLRSLEIRTSPVTNRDAQLKLIRRLQKHWRTLHTTAGQTRDGRLRATGWRQTECGLVLHFLKFRGKHSDRGEPRAFDAGNFADPSARGNLHGYRWGEFFLARRKEARAIASAVRHDLTSPLPRNTPPIVYFLRGIDVCRDEHGVPAWVVAPLFRLVRRAIEEAIGEYRGRRGIELPLPRTTAHVGEDFVHLATGLRYMDEALDYLPLRSGDRVGHGLALGVRPKEWARKSTRLAMPREDRWLDLIWERAWHARTGANFAPDRRACVEDEIIRLSREMFADGEPWTPDDAQQLVRGLYSAESLQAAGFPNGRLPAAAPTGIRRRLERYLTDRMVYRRGREIEWVRTETEGDSIKELQRLVRKRFAETGITIEVNPISNLLVGDLTELTSHPLWRLAPGLGNDKGLTLRICVGSDDPLPFATTLPEEYQFLYDSLVLAGQSQAEARAWLEHVRKLSWESRFTVSAPGIAASAGN